MLTDCPRSPMVVDTSAIISILQDEPERRHLNELLEEAETRVMSTATFVEASIVIEARYGPDGVRDLDLLLSKAQINLVAVDKDQAHMARRAFREYGKGRHPAGLNYGDCFTYALAKTLAEPVLCKGNDFPNTDLDTVLTR